MSQPSGDIVVGGTEEYRFEVVPSTSIPATTGVLSITFPVEITVLETGSCTAETATVAHTCTLSSDDNTVTVSFTEDLTPSDTLTVSVPDSIKNPATGSSSGFITLSSGYTDESNTFITLDENSNEFTVTPNKYNTLTIVSITRATSFYINNVTAIDVLAKTTNPIPTGATIYIELPKDQVRLDVTDITYLTYNSLDENNGILSVITADSEIDDTDYLRLNFTEWCSAWQGSCPETGENIRFRILGLQNPPTTFLPSDSFKIYMDAANGAIIDSIEENTFAVPPLRAGLLEDVTITRDTNMTGDVVTYTVNFTTTHDIVESEGVDFVMQLPDEFLYEGDSLNCTYMFGTISGCSVVTEETGYGNMVTEVRIPMGCGETECRAHTFIVSFSGARNPFIPATLEGTLTLATQGFVDGVAFWNDVLDMDLEDDVPELRSFTPQICDGTAQRSHRFVDEDVIVTLNITLVNRILEKDLILIKVPLDQFPRNADTIQYTITGENDVKDMSIHAIDSAHVTLEFEEFCSNGASRCQDGSFMSITIPQGFKNPISDDIVYTNFFVFQAWTASKIYKLEESEGDIEAYPAMAKVDITDVSVEFQSPVVAYDGYVDISATMNHMLTDDDYVVITVDGDFLLQSDENITWYEIVDSSPVRELNCTVVFDPTTGYLQNITVDDLCACDETTNYTIRIDGVRNLLEGKDYQGTLTYHTYPLVGEILGEGILDLSTLDTLQPAEMTIATATRSVQSLGAYSDITLDFTTPAILLDESRILIGFPLDQVLIDGLTFTCVDSSTNADLGCSQTPGSNATHYFVLLGEWKCIDSNCDADTPFSLIISSAQNPFEIITDPETISIDFISPSSNPIFTAPVPVIATPELILGTLDNFTVLQQNTLYAYDPTEYVLSFDSTSGIPEDGKIVFEFPDNRIWIDSDTPVVVYSGDDLTTPVTGVTVVYDDTNTWIDKVEITSFCPTGCEPGYFEFKLIGGNQNPNAEQEIIGDFVVSLTTPTDSLISTASLPNANVSSILPNPTKVLPDDPTVGRPSNYEVIFTIDEDIPQNSSLVITLPDGVTISGTNEGGNSQLDTCRHLFDAIINIACVIGTDSNGKTTVTIEGLFPDEINSGQFGLEIGLIDNPDSEGDLDPFVIDVFDEAGNPVTSLEVKNPTKIKTEVADEDCADSCATCSGEADSCDTCKTPSNLAFFEENVCNSVCEKGTFTVGQKCYQCFVTCEECSGYKSSHCLTCKDGFYFENGECVAECSETTALNEKGECQNTETVEQCDSSCQTCSKDTNRCLIWDPNSDKPILNPIDGSCVENKIGACGEGFFANNQTNTCEKCSAECLDCEFAKDQCFKWYDFTSTPLLDWKLFKCVDNCSEETFFNETSNSCPACNPVWGSCNSGNPTECTSCGKTEKGKQLYLDNGEWVIECRKPYVVNDSTNECVKKGVNFASPAVISVFFLVFFAFGFMFLSALFRLIKRKKFGDGGSILDEIFAMMCLAEFWNRICLMSNLWAFGKVFSFGTNFMNIVCTQLLAIFFYTLFLKPILSFSPHFRNHFNGHKKIFTGIIWASFIVGVNFTRLLHSSAFGSGATSAGLNNHYFFLKPLNIMSCLTLVFTGFQIVVCANNLFEFSVSQDAWALSCCGLCLNWALSLFQIVKILQFFRFKSQNYSPL